MSALWLWIVAAMAQDLVAKADVVHIVGAEPIEKGVVVVKDGRIAAVGKQGEVALPAGVPVVEGAVLTPGLVDGLSQVGLTGVYNSDRDQDHRERVGAVHPELLALDGYNSWETLVGWLARHGVTTAQIAPSPGGAIAGRTAVVSTVPGRARDVALVADGAVVFTLGDAAKRVESGPTSRMGSAAAIRQALTEAREYGQRRKLPLADRPPVDLGKDALVDVLEGRRKAVIVAHRADDVLTAVRLVEAFELDAVISGASEGYLVRDELAAAGIPVLVGPVMVRSWAGDGEASNASYENAALLADAGVSVGFTGGFEGYVPKVRVVLWEAAIAASNGLGRSRTLEALTLGGARAAGVDDEIGSLMVGKRADLVLFDGDPFEYTSHVCTVVFEGVVVHDLCH